MVSVDSHENSTVRRGAKLLTIVVACSVVVWGVISFFYGRYRQNEAIATAEQMGAGYDVDDQSPQWLRDWVGEESARMDVLVTLDFRKAPEVNLKPFRGLSSVRFLNLHGVGTDADLQEAADMLGLEEIELQSSSVTDQGLASLAHLEQVRDLSVVNTNISDAGLRSLRKFQHLEHLCVSRTRITSAGLAHLTGMPLVRIEATATAVDDAGLAWLAEIKSLQRISLTNTPVGDRGMEYLATLPNLRHLDLNGTQVTDAGLRAIGRISTLEHLMLSRTSVGDTGMAQLTKLANLKTLALFRTRVTRGSIEALAQLQGLTEVLLIGSPFSVEDRAELQARLPNTAIK